jgi:predicted O-methyltransferase YrrM
MNYKRIVLRLRIRLLLLGIDKDSSVTFEEAVALYRFVKEQDLSGDIVELGAYKGRSTLCLALGCRAANNGKVYGIDKFVFKLAAQEKYGNPPETESIFDHNIKKKGLKNRVVKKKSSFQEAVKGWSEPIRFLFIDGAHSYEGTKANFLSWEPFVKVGGVIAFHDSVGGKWPGVTQCVEEFVRGSDKFANLKIVHSITFVEKVNE